LCTNGTETWVLAMPFLSFGIVLMVLINMALDFSFFLTFIPSLILLIAIRYMPVIFFTPHRIISWIYFSFFFHFVMYWQGIYALFTIKNKKWITR